MTVIYYQNAEHNVIWLDIPGCAKESEGVQYNVKKTKCYNHSWIKNKKGYTPIFLCFTDKIKQGHVRCKKYYTPWIKRLVLSVYDKYYIFLFNLTSYKIQDFFNDSNQTNYKIILFLEKHYLDSECSIAKKFNTYSLDILFSYN